MAQGNRIVILQNEQLKKIIDIDVQNLNIVDASLKDLNATEEREDMVGLNSVLEDMVREKGGAGIQLGQKEQSKVSNIKSLQNNLEFLSMTATRRGFILGGSKGYNNNNYLIDVYVCMNSIRISPSSTPYPFQ